MMAKYDLTEAETWTIITQAVNFGMTQLVDGNWGMHALIPKSIFEGVERKLECALADTEDAVEDVEDIVDEIEDLIEDIVEDIELSGAGYIGANLQVVLSLALLFVAFSF